MPFNCSAQFPHTQFRQLWRTPDATPRAIWFRSFLLPGYSTQNDRIVN